MASALSSRKGIETAPLFFIFSAVVLLLTAAVVFPYFSEWQRIMNEGKARKEAIKLQSAINEIHAMGDLGSSERLSVYIPTGYSIMIDGQSLKVRGPTKNYAGKETKGDPLTLNTRIDTNVYEITSGPKVIMVIYSADGSVGENQIFVRPR